MAVNRLIYFFVLILSTETFGDPVVEAHPFSSQVVAEQDSSFENHPLPIRAINPKARDVFFKKIGFDKYIKDFDELERNELILKLERFSIERLRKSYSKIPEKDLVFAQKKLRGAE